MQNELKKKLWTKEFIILLIISSVSMASTAVVNNIISAFIVEELNGTASQVGTQYSLMIFCAFLSRPMAGYLVDKIGRKKTLLLALVLTGILNLFLFANITLKQLAVIRFLCGIPFSLNSIALATLIADILPKERMSEGLVVRGFITAIIGQVLIPFISFWMLDRYGYTLNFITSAILTVLAILLLLKIQYTDIKNPSIKFSMKTSLEPKVVWTSIVLALLFAGTPIIGSFGPLYASEVGLQERGLFFVFYGLGSFVSIPLNKFLVTRKWPKVATLFSSSVYMIGHAIIGVLASVPMFLIGVFIIGMGFSISTSTLQTVAMNLVKPAARGKANATTQLGCDIGAVLGSTVFGYIAQATGSYQPLFTANAFLLLIPFFIALRFLIPHYEKNYIR